MVVFVLMLFFFFFKQKTAYEMRISDWSSDVCSSELDVPCISVLDPILMAFASHLNMQSQSRPGRQHMLNAAYFSRMDAMDFALGHDDGQSAGELHKIGRASCRERVGQHV